MSFGRKHRYKIVSAVLTSFNRSLRVETRPRRLTGDTRPLTRRRRTPVGDFYRDPLVPVCVALANLPSGLDLQAHRASTTVVVTPIPASDSATSNAATSETGGPLCVAIAAQQAFVAPSAGPRGHRHQLGRFDTGGKRGGGQAAGHSVQTSWTSGGLLGWLECRRSVANQCVRLVLRRYSSQLAGLTNRHVMKILFLVRLLPPGRWLAMRLLRGRCWYQPMCYIRW